MIEAAKELGFDEDAAKQLVTQTLYGSAALLRHAEKSPDELIKQVASKGGTTEAVSRVARPATEAARAPSLRLLFAPTLLPRKRLKLTTPAP